MLNSHGHTETFRAKINAYVSRITSLQILFKKLFHIFKNYDTEKRKIFHRICQPRLTRKRPENKKILLYNVK
jgi:hypothetical protein